MPNPETVQQSQSFNLDKVIYNDDDFAIAVGVRSGEDKICLAMRWNGDENGAGFPFAGKHPLWLSLPSDLTQTFLLGLLQKQSLTEDSYLSILDYLRGVEIILPNHS
ncbi:hypothetical protein [Nonlabens marinus]|uniref:Uncharacterized protein n=1 Tax=Nonlabens marinus S1-08 TaxID=1454201 RepID=W8VUZ6_9FLAO|nr:hypothetical protein [Nonlabens marinus]BAO55013.1 hypothetical protein NMS_1004 [Nonlabens marinus S1-08]